MQYQLEEQERKREEYRQQLLALETQQQRLSLDDNTRHSSDSNANTTASTSDLHKNSVKRAWPEKGATCDHYC